MVQIKEISNIKLEELTFDWSGSEEFVWLNSIDSESSKPNFIINEDTANFTLISKSLIIQEFKYIKIIFQTFEPTINTTLIE